MRTTLTIDDDVFAAAQELANSTGRAVDAVLSELARSGLPSKPSRYRRKNKLATFQVSPNAPLIRADRVAEILAEEQ